jgi:uncharacterized caspase-like protein
MPPVRSFAPNSTVASGPRSCARTALLGFCILASLAVGPGSALAQAPSTERPSYAVGDQWILKDGVYDLVRIEKDGYVFAASPTRRIYLTKDLVVSKVEKDGTVEWSVFPTPSLPWPLVVGKWGVTYRAVLTNRDHPSGINVRLIWEVKAYEDVHVVAGSFKAFRIAYRAQLDTGDDIRRTPNVSGPQSWTFTTWYAPEVRLIVKMEAVNQQGLNAETVTVGRKVPAPLQIVLDEPKDQARPTTQDITAVGAVRSGRGISRVTASLNGAGVFARDEHNTPVPEMTLTFPVTLRPGKNLLVVTAIDADGNTRQEARVLFRDSAPGTPPVVPTPHPPTTAPPAATSTQFQIVVSSPRDQLQVDQESIALAGMVSGGKGVRRVLITLNGAEAARLEDRTLQQTVALNQLLKLREGQNTLVITATDADGVSQQEVRTVQYNRLVPLTIRFRHPEDRSTVGDSAALVAAEVTSGKGVAAVSVILNGAEVFKEVERKPTKSVGIAAPVKLRDGNNTIVVRANETDGTVHQEVRSVTFERPPPGPTISPVVPTRNRERWAVVIGVGRYENPTIPKLQFASADAEALYQVLVTSAGFKKDNVLLLTDTTSKKPTLREVKWALGTFLARSAKKDDLVLIFFAGHGAPEVDPRGVESDGLAKYLVPSDADPNDLYSTGLPMDEFQTIFERIEAEQVVVFLDSCYSGAAGGRTFSSTRTRNSRVDDIFLERLTRSKGRAIITASRASEVSIELPELGHGVFSFYLVQGLRGAADLDRDGVVTVQELYQYLEEQVAQRSRAVGGNQHPVMKGEMDGVLPLVKVGGR